MLGRMPVNVESGSQLEIGGIPATVCFSSEVGAVVVTRDQGHGLPVSSPDATSAFVGCLALRLPVPPLWVFHPSVSRHKASLQAAKLQTHPGQL